MFEGWIRGAAASVALASVLGVCGCSSPSAESTGAGGAAQELGDDDDDGSGGDDYLDKCFGDTIDARCPGDPTGETHDTSTSTSLLPTLGKYEVADGGRVIDIVVTKASSSDLTFHITIARDDEVVYDDSEDDGSYQLARSKDQHTWQATLYGEEQCSFDLATVDEHTLKIENAYCHITGMGVPLDGTLTFVE